jgi:hypothetical protein
MTPNKYKWRRLVENFFCAIKAFRRIATRYEKTDTCFAAMINVVAVAGPDECKQPYAPTSFSTTTSNAGAETQHLRAFLNAIKHPTLEVGYPGSVA